MGNKTQLRPAWRLATWRPAPRERAKCHKAVKRRLVTGEYINIRGDENLFREVNAEEKLIRAALEWKGLMDLWAVRANTPAVEFSVRGWERERERERERENESALYLHKHHLYCTLHYLFYCGVFTIHKLYWMLSVIALPGCLFL